MSGRPRRVVRSGQRRIDDACDPNQGSDDTLALFDGFNAFGAWTIESGTWDLVDGAFVNGGTGALESMVAPISQPTLVVVIDEIEISPGGAIGAFAEQDNFRSACEVARIASGLVLRVAGSFDPPVPVSGSGALRLSGGQLANTNTYCRAKFADGAAVQLESQFLFGIVAIDKIGLVATDATGTFRSVAAFAGPPVAMVR